MLDKVLFRYLSLIRVIFAPPYRSMPAPDTAYATPRSRKNSSSVIGVGELFDLLKELPIPSISQSFLGIKKTPDHSDVSNKRPDLHRNPCSEQKLIHHIAVFSAPTC